MLTHDFQGSLTFYLKLLETAGRVKVTQKAAGFTGNRASGLKGDRPGRQQEISLRTNAGESGKVCLEGRSLNSDLISDERQLSEQVKGVSLTRWEGLRRVWS